MCTTIGFNFFRTLSFDDPKIFVKNDIFLSKANLGVYNNLKRQSTKKDYACLLDTKTGMQEKNLHQWSQQIHKCN